jgi:hypothetical protein
MGALEMCQFRYPPCSRFIFRTPEILDSYQTRPVILSDDFCDLRQILESHIKIDSDRFIFSPLFNHYLLDVTYRIKLTIAEDFSVR